MDGVYGAINSILIDLFFSFGDGVSYINTLTF